MPSISLTPDVCARLRDPTDYRVLVSCPTLQVTEIEELVGRGIGGFFARYRATLMDGADVSSQVVFPDGADIGLPVGAGPVAAGAVIKIDQMVRVPNGQESVIVVYSAEAVTSDFTLKLTDMDKELRRLTDLLRSETELRQKTEAHLQALLPANLAGLTPQTLVNQLFDVLVQVLEVTGQTIA